MTVIEADRHNDITFASSNWQLHAAGRFDFFHDHDLLAALQTAVLPQLFAAKDPSADLRVWAPECGTGEAAYGLAMLLHQSAEQAASPPAIQIFATDGDAGAIAIARAGVYPAAIESDIGPERISRFFDLEEQRYRVKKGLRSLVIFATHDLLHDPGFGHLDLLFYAGRPSERKQLIQKFQYVLRPGGYLVLGAADRSAGVAELFAEVGDTGRLFQPRHVVAPPPVRQGGGALRSLSMAARSGEAAPNTSIRDLHLRLLARHSAPSVLIDAAYQIVHVSKRDPRLFDIPAGRLTRNLLDVIHAELRPLVRSALVAAAGQSGNVEPPPMLVNLSGAICEMRLLVRRLTEPEWARGYFQVIFEQHSYQARDGAREPLADAAHSQRLWGQMVHQYEAAIEGQLLAHDELQLMNEQLQALNEELGSSQEQLSTINQELQSSNTELRRRVIELTRANNDLNNLIGATDIATIFLDAALQITRFTSQAQHLFNLIFADRGRPIAHITHMLEYDQLLPDIASVVNSLQSVEREVRGADNCWYLARLRPYRTTDDQIDGVVLIFIDITARKLAEDALRQARDDLEQRVIERTHALMTTNTRLQAEIAERLELEKLRKQLLRALMTSQEDERRRIARELHDQLGQALSALNMGLAALAGPALAPPVRQDTIARLQAIVSQLDEDVDRLALELRPGVLDDLGLLAAVQQYTEEWGEHHAITLEFQSAGMDGVRLTPEIELVLYRMLQEALTNVLKHAHAQHVSVLLERRSDQVHLIVEDDGRGFDLAAQQQSNDRDAQRQLGLLGMDERITFVGGNLTIDAALGAGTTLFARIPIPPPIERHANE